MADRVEDGRQLMNLRFAIWGPVLPMRRQDPAIPQSTGDPLPTIRPQDRTWPIYISVETVDRVIEHARQGAEDLKAANRRYDANFTAWQSQRTGEEAV